MLTFVCVLGVGVCVVPFVAMGVVTTLVLSMAILLSFICFAVNQRELPPSTGVCRARQSPAPPTTPSARCAVAVSEYVQSRSATATSGCGTLGSSALSDSFVVVDEWVLPSMSTLNGSMRTAIESLCLLHYKWLLAECK